jgi:ATPase subunit of ABC transporter with duplicated ATPase domains
MKPRVLLKCDNVGYSSSSSSGNSVEEKWDILKLSLELHAGDRAAIRFQNEEQKQVLWRLFLQKLKPKTGSFIITAKTHIHTDNSLWEGTDKKTTLLENMNSKLFTKRPWFGGQRKNIETLMDRLALNGRIPHLPVEELSEEQAARFWVLMLVSANTKVVLIDRLFSLLDKVSLPFVQEWLESYTGIIILFGEHAEYFNAVKTHQPDRQQKSKTLFNSVISFSADGQAKYLLQNV